MGGKGRGFCCVWRVVGGRLESFEEANAEANEANTPVTFDCRHPSHVYLVSDRRSQITDHNHMHMHVHMTRSHHTTLPQQHTTATTTMPQRLDDSTTNNFSPTPLLALLRLPQCLAWERSHPRKTHLQKKNPHPPHLHPHPRPHRRPLRLKSRLQSLGRRPFLLGRKWWL